MSFRDRSEAGCRLAAELAKYKGENCVVLALPRGGAPVAAPIALALNAPLDLVLVHLNLRVDVLAQGRVHHARDHAARQ